MANATKKVDKGTVRWTDEFYKRGLKTLSAETVFYVGAMVGRNADGYLAKFDDTVELIFDGVVRGKDGGNITMAIATQGDAGHDLDIHRPRYIELAVSSVALTDIGKKVYASDDQNGVIDVSTRTYGNLIGTIVDKVATSIALVELAYDGIAAHARLGASRFLPATGTQTLTKLDLFKTIVIINTAAQTINLPAVAGTQAGDWIQFVKKSSDAFAATLDASGAEEIDSSTTYAAIDAEHDCARLVSDGTQWHIANRDIA